MGSDSGFRGYRVCGLWHVVFGVEGLELQDLMRQGSLFWGALTGLGLRAIRVSGLGV